VCSLAEDADLGLVAGDIDRQLAQVVDELVDVLGLELVQVDRRAGAL
jgi:hypothetical protein